MNSRDIMRDGWADASWFPISHGIIHAIIDASCVMTIFSLRGFHKIPPLTGFYIVMAYDLLAFAGQAPLGFLIDKARFYRGALLAGIGLTAAGILARGFNPFVALAFVGIGNALFHIGAGALSLHVNPGHATPPGLFVAPGALGLAFGIWAGKGGLTSPWPFLAALAVSMLVACMSANPEVKTPERRGMLDVKWPVAALLLLLFSVGIRSLVGSAGTYLSPKELTVSFGFAFAAFAGKASGGIIADRVGWIAGTVAALLISAPFIAFGGENHVLVTIGILFFQMTMPVTLTAVAALLPGRTAFAFGLTCLALIAGAIPTFSKGVKSQYNSSLFLASILLSTAAVGIGLHLLRNKVPMKFKA